MVGDNDNSYFVARKPVILGETSLLITFHGEFSLIHLSQEKWYLRICHFSVIVQT